MNSVCFLGNDQTLNEVVSTLLHVDDLVRFVHRNTHLFEGNRSPGFGPMHLLELLRCDHLQL